MKNKRKKPFNATGAAVKHLVTGGWTVSVTEQTIPHTFIKRDTFGFADLLCCSPSRGIMLVQVTGGTGKGNFNARVAKIKAEPRHAIWLASGGRIRVMSYEVIKDKKERSLREIEICCETNGEPRQAAREASDCKLDAPAALPSAIG